MELIVATRILPFPNPPHPSNLPTVPCRGKLRLTTRPPTPICDFMPEATHDNR